MVPSSTQDVVDRLRQHVCSPNSVYATGFALEKVHSGVLCWLLNSPEHGPALAAEVWNLASGRVEVSAGQLGAVHAKREHRVGQKSGIIDMLIQFTNNATGRDCSVLCEYKVDGSGDHKRQCAGFHDEWSGSKEASRFVFATMGGARFLDPRPDPPWCQFGPREMRDLLLPYRSIELVRDYLIALDDELDRGEIAPMLAAGADRSF